jgi:hypothetical protein
LHRRAYTVAVAEVDVVAHAQFVAVVQGRRAGHRQQQAVQQLDAAAVTFHQRRQTPADAEVDPCATVGRVVIPQVVAFLVGDHLQRQFIVVAQKKRPLTIPGDLGSLTHDLKDRRVILFADRHKNTRHERKVKGHVAFVTVDTCGIGVTEVQLGVFRPLVGFGQQHGSG